LEDGYSYINKLEIKTTNKSNIVIVGECEISLDLLLKDIKDFKK
jgi:hypothetical protein